MWGRGSNLEYGNCSTVQFDLTGRCPDTLLIYYALIPYLTSTNHCSSDLMKRLQYPCLIFTC